MMKTLGVLRSEMAKKLGLLVAVAVTALPAPMRADDRSPTVLYDHPVVLVEGDAPIQNSYQLGITSPTNVTAPTTITPLVTVLSAPAGVSTAQALSYVSLNPTPLFFSGPGVTVTTTVTSNIPITAVSGDYQYRISTPGWPAGTLDPFAQINMKLTVSQVPQRPSVVINTPANPSTYNYTLNGPAVSIPLQFTSSAPAYAPIISAGADISGVNVDVTSTGLGTGNVVSNGTISLSAPGIYTITAHANNINGTSSTTSEVTIKLAVPPPTVTIVNPLPNSTYTYTAGGPALSVPYTFTAVSAQGGVTAISATLNGAPISLGTTTGLGTLNATASGSLSLTATGSYVLAVTATDANGTATTSRTFTVSAPVQTGGPTVTITKPIDGASYTRVSGGDSICIPFSFTAEAASGSKISSLSAKLNGVSVDVNASGIGRKTATGTGSITVRSAGTYTLVASATSSGQVGTDHVSFTVVVTEPPPPVCEVVWLPPISLGKGQTGGCTVPIRFQIHCSSSNPDCNRGGDDDDRRDCRDNDRDYRDNDHDGRDNDRDCRDNDRDRRDDDHRSDRDCRDDDRRDNDRDHDCNLHETSVKILVSEIYSNGSSSNPKIFSYGRGSSNYSIECDDQYELDFDTARGKHTYHIDIYRFPNGGTTPQLVGTKEFKTY
jgi:hypothetical protein